MKKQKITIIAVIALILCVAVGYALFSETLKVEGTATASGTFDIKMECVSQEVIGEGVEQQCSVDEDKNTVTTTSTLKKPTDAVGFIVKITNSGTIDAKLTNIESPNNKSMDLTTSGKAAYLNDKYLMAYYDIRKYNDGTDANESDSYCDVDTCDDSAFKNANITLQPWESVYLIIAHGWADSKEVEQPKLDNGTATMNYNVTLSFTQATNE